MLEIVRDDLPYLLMLHCCPFSDTLIHETLLSRPSAQTKVDNAGSIEFLIEPDYTKSLMAVYANVAQRLIMTTKRLDVLSYVRDHEASESPSWAPTWSQQLRSFPLLDSHVRFCAAGKGRYQDWEEETVMPSLVGKKGLRVDAFPLGNIIWSSEPMVFMNGSVTACTRF
jgi:hypothetical protein